eukprot:TRINITY_DN13449_c0_g1_i1.p1 TRINITY_DN13449_c0_g1~~TRINITY_DN13449_c0_g1_i1.p1  ORF type:complete len:609 (+),score=108.67 TRINITY_DN13449_c0_g1_i1:397-2223(+)
MATGAKKFINDPANVVEEMIEGLVETYAHLTYLDGFPNVKVVLRADVTRGTFNKVAVISGGGAGHEPAHGGFVGQGMLTAAVCGDVFASPSVNAILMAIRAVTGHPGCLLVVKNYTGDRLNFGLAAEQAKMEGFKVETVIVGDDCALPPPHGLAGRRGLAGTLFVHKVAGAAAEAGLSLTDVAAEARTVAGLVGTMGVALSVGTIPGGIPSQRLGPTKMELGLGIHGEPGTSVTDLKSADLVVRHLLKQILNTECGYVPVKLGSRVAIMVNSLGGTPNMEVMIAAGKAVALLQLEHGLGVERVYAGTFMTSLEMAGLSLSILKVEDAILKRLDAPTKAPAWPTGSAGPRPPTTVPVPLPASPADTATPSTRPKELTATGQSIENAIRGGAQALVDLGPQLNEWDRGTGDGDCGTTMSKTANAILSDLAMSYALNDPIAAVRCVGSTIQQTMGGTSGVLYDIFSRAAVVRLRETVHAGVCTPNNWAAAFEAGVAAIKKYGGAERGFRTMLDALIPASAKLTEKLKEGLPPLQALGEAVRAAQEGAEETRGMAAQVGRSSYVPQEALGSIPDPGAMAAAAWLAGIAKGLSPASAPSQPLQRLSSASASAS